MFFPIIGFQMVTANFFQSIGMASKAIFLSLTRQMVVLLPCLLILPRFFGAAGVWYSMPISDLLASLIAGTMLVWQFRNLGYRLKGDDNVVAQLISLEAEPWVCVHDSVSILIYRIRVHAGPLYSSHRG